MKKTLFILLCFGVACVQSKAQIAKWLISPQYGNIQLANGIDGIITDSLGNTTVWTMDGQKILSTNDELMPFKNGQALALKPGSSLISAIFKSDGTCLEINDCSVTHDYPFFSNGKLLVKHNYYYKYIDTNGEFIKGDYVSAYPYHNGYASCITFLNMEKKTDMVHFLIDENGSAVNFIFQDKQFAPNDVQFVSSVNDENICVVVIKQKLYLYNGKDKQLVPVLENDSVKNFKGQAKISSSIEECCNRQADSSFELIAKCGKKGVLTVSFDPMGRPVSITKNGIQHFYKKKDEKEEESGSPLKIKQKGQLYGLDWDSIEMLPPQFDNVIACVDDKALVRFEGKCGLVRIYKDAAFSIKMNKGDDIAFRHQKFETSIRVDFPPILSADKVNIDINPETGCYIDKTSKEFKSTESGNYVQYNCVLNIPDSLPDELTQLEYPVTMICDRLKSSVIPFNVKAWHYKYFVVDIDDSQTMLEKGNVSFVFNINAERIAGDGVYPTKVMIVTDSLQYEYEKLSEIRHKCKVYELKEGVNNIVVQIIEQGCPPAVFPFEVEYHKPVAKTRNKPAEKEKVTITKKTRAISVSKEQELKPRVIM